MRSALFLDIMQRRVVIYYRRFGTTYLLKLRGSKNRRRTPVTFGTKCAWTMEWSTDTLLNCYRLFYWIFWRLKLGRISYLETLVRSYCVISQKSAESDQRRVFLSTDGEANNFTKLSHTCFQLEPCILNTPQYILYHCYTTLRLYRVKVLPVPYLGRQ